MADFQLTQSGQQVQDALDQVPINESAIATNTSAIGTLSSLTTTEKGSLVGAVNEVNGVVADLGDAVDLLNSLTPVLGGIADHVGSCEIGDLLIQWGAETVTPTANAVTVVAVTFDKAYANSPWLGVTVRSSSVNQITGLGCTSTSTTGTNLRFYRTNTTSTTIGWIAIGKKASGGGDSLNSINPITPINLNPLSPTVVNEEEEEM